MCVKRHPFWQNFFGCKFANDRHIAQSWALWTFFCGVISRILSIRMLLKVLLSSRKKLNMQLGKSIWLCVGQYSQSCWKGLLLVWRMKEVISNTYYDLKNFFLLKYFLYIVLLLVYFFLVLSEVTFETLCIWVKF